jgi:D-tyrosyl-tRNA(Tyr) deacylase
MRALIQRVQNASVEVEQKVVGSIGPGLLVLLGVTHSDSQEDITYLSKKIAQLRLFADEQGMMNRSVLDTQGDVLVVSQFTLYGSTKKGNRPSYVEAAPGPIAQKHYEDFVAQLEKLLEKPVATGVFGADMQVQLLNDGPVTLMIDTHQKN